MIQRVRDALLAMQRHSWEQGVAIQALLALGETERAVQLAHQAVARQMPDGRLAVMGANEAVTDPGAAGEAVLRVARLTGDQALVRGADRCLQYLLHDAPRTPDGTWHHLQSAPQVWIDSLYMGPPFVAAAGRVDVALAQIEGMRRRLWIEDKQLFAHMWDEAAGTFARADCWGVGNGWAAAGLVRALHVVEPQAPEAKPKLVGYLRAVVDGCLAHRREDGLFHDVVDDPSTFVETNLSQILAWCIYESTSAGWLPERYLEEAERMRAAALEQVDDRGFVQGVGQAPHFDRPGTSPEGQAFFLLMEAARPGAIQRRQVAR